MGKSNIQHNFFQLFKIHFEFICRCIYFLDIVNLQYILFTYFIPPIFFYLISFIQTKMNIVLYFTHKHTPAASAFLPLGNFPHSVSWLGHAGHDPTSDKVRRQPHRRWPRRTQSPAFSVSSCPFSQISLQQGQT